MNRTVDVAVVGSGLNGLVAAAYLARSGWSVEVLERNSVPGGAIATEELTVPGYLHDTFSQWHSLFQLSDSWVELGDELRARGLAYCVSDVEATAGVNSSGAATVAYRDPVRTADGFSVQDRATYLSDLEQLGTRLPLVGPLLGMELHSRRAARISAVTARKLGRGERLPFVHDALLSTRGWLSRYTGAEPDVLWGPWVLHTGQTPDGAGGAFATRAIAGAVHAVGMPIVRGGSARFVEALVKLIEDHGGNVVTDATVRTIVVRNGRAVGVRTDEGELRATRAVIANVTPTQLYGELVEATATPEGLREEAGRYRYNPRAGAQLHLALRGAPRWRDKRLDRVPFLHVADGAAGVSLACAEAAAGLLPARPTVGVGQPTILDQSRAPEGGSVLWIQLQEVPYAPVGDAAGEIDVGDGTWTAELADAYADRVVDRVAEHFPTLREQIVGRAFISPRDIERKNPNLVRGDIYSGDTDLAQSYLWRPLPNYGSHDSPIERLFHCGASTFPGPGLSGSSGRIVAQALLGRRSARRLRRP